MTIYLSENIKRLRLEKGITQETLSEFLGVTSQSVSNWERGESYPDITMLPEISGFFKVSVDELLGVNRAEDETEIIKELEAYDNLTDEKLKIEIINKLKEKFPNDFRILLRYMTSLVHFKENTPENVAKIIAIYENIKQNCNNDKIRISAKRHIAELYKELSEKEGSGITFEDCEKIIKEMPRMRDGQEMFCFYYPENYPNGDEIIMNTLEEQFLLLNTVYSHYFYYNGFFYDRNFSDEWVISAFKSELDFLNFVYDDGHYGKMWRTVMYNHGHLGVRYFKMGDKANALANFKKMCALAIKFDNMDRITTIVIVMLFDGMGVSVIKEHLAEDAFLRQHHLTDISSVYPSTTVAALTAIESGYSPTETGWIGWDLYFDEIGENVTVFKNALQRNGEPAAEYNVPYKYIPYKRIFQRIEEVRGRKTAYCVSAFSKYRSKSVHHICKTVYRLSKRRKQKYIYTYWHQPDNIMHIHGVHSREAKNEVENINREVEKLCKKLKNSLVIITADHGQIDCTNAYLEDYSILKDMLKIPPSVEPRALSLFIKDGKVKAFKEEFNKVFGDSFRLMTKDEVFAENLLGYGISHPKTKDFIGDYLAVATSNVILNYERSDFEPIGGHAGLLEEEMTVPFIATEMK